MNNKVVIGIGAMIVVLFISLLVVQTFQINSIKKEIPEITGYVTKQISTNGWTENELMNYIEKVLTALEIQSGPAHAEVMYDEKGPVLIEVGARIDGMENPKFWRECIGYSQVDLTLESYLFPEKMLEQRKREYSLLKEATVVSLVSHQEGIIQSTENFDKIRNLPSCCELVAKVGLGSKITKTRDLFSIPGIAFLVHKDRSVIEKDYQTIRRLEKEGFFKL